MIEEETQTSKTSRRNMLRLAVPAAAGVAALAAAGAVELGHAPAALAADGNTFLLGQSNSASHQTSLASDGSVTAGALLVTDNTAASTSSVLYGIQGFSPNGNTGTAGISGNLGFLDVVPVKTATGVYGMVAHQSGDAHVNVGYGVIAHAHRAQAPLRLINSSSSAAPTSSADDGSVNVDGNGTLYSRRFGGWYNLSSFNFLPSPVRIIGAVNPGQHLAKGTNTPFTVAGVSGIPANAVAVFGNVNISAGVTGSGFVTVTAHLGSATTNTINFTPSDVRLSNFCMVRLSGGKIDVHVSNNVDVDFSFDCAGYII